MHECGTPRTSRKGPGSNQRVTGGVVAVVVLAVVGFAIGCEGLFYELDDLERPDVADTGDGDPRPCADEEHLFFEGERVELGDECGPCGESEIVCDGEQEVKCSPGIEPNQCGGCDPLPGVEGEPCGKCETGHWECQDEETMECVGAAEEHNVCGGCEELPTDQINSECTDTGDDSVGLWKCAGPEEMNCTVPPGNACGGTSDLDPAPGDECGPCGEGTYACDGEDDVECVNEDFGVNACGGCEPLEGVEGGPCGRCGGEWICDEDDDDELTCDDPGTNLCGGCEDDIGHGVPGEPCGDDGEFQCLDRETMVCNQ